MRLIPQPESEAVRSVRASVEVMLQSLARSYEKPMEQAARISDPDTRHQRMQQLRNDYHEMAHRIQKPLRDVIALTPPPPFIIYPEDRLEITNPPTPGDGR